MVSHMEKRLDLNFNVIRIKLCYVLEGHFLFACSENGCVYSVKFQVLFFLHVYVNITELLSLGKIVTVENLRGRAHRSVQYYL